MAVDVCCEIASLVVSPRISFSHDDGIPIECCLLESSSTIDFDFDFCVNDNQPLISSADELFSNGKILPVEVKKIAETNHSLQKQPNPLRKEPFLENDINKKKSLKEFLSTDLDEDDSEDEDHAREKSRQVKPFWQFRRSSSLNNHYQNSQNNGSFLHFLTRSNSTGSTPITKNPKIYHKQSSQREKIKVLRKSSSLSSSSTSSSSSSSSFSTFNHSHSLHSSSKKSQSQPLKKSYSRSYGNGVHVSPVLNIPHGYISKESNPRHLIKDGAVPSSAPERMLVTRNYPLS
ncbi:hypothetical protein T459_26821 [Capsicum annuum]|uniref:Uncharacterized protein n=1 Tax=Capsicum annuum TaxID=4072 RepID=A0A2G2YC78_CAPAN|nr:SWI5-dependent HO expression protein 3 [Capsicum annuum]PHT67334.1 hypothetical protein T459_26821 [Capsicum annuum]